MSRRVASCLVTVGVCFAVAAAAETVHSASTAYHVEVSAGELIDQPNGQKLRTGVRSHANVVFTAGSMTGQTASQWCDGTTLLDASGAPTLDVGYCTLTYDSGDKLWVSFLVRPGQSSNWTVIGGTGRLEGATGSGSTTATSERGDGLSWTSQSQGTINVE